jgi:hypothetical protein
MDGNVPAAHVRDLVNAVGHRLPSLGAGFQQPCRNDGDFRLGKTRVCRPAPERGKPNQHPRLAALSLRPYPQSLRPSAQHQRPPK